MAYCTLDDLLAQISEAELIELTDDDAAGEVDAATVARAIADAASEIDSYARTRYPVPLSPVPDKVRAVGVDLSLYRLHQRRGIGMGRDHPRRIACEEGRSWLKDLARGLVTLGSDTPAPTNDDRPKATTQAGDRVFTRGKASGGSSGSLDDY